MKEIASFVLLPIFPRLINKLYSELFLFVAKFSKRTSV